MATELIELTNTDRAFYPTLGPFLANRAVHKAIGGVPWDDDTKTWIVLRDKHKGVLGFVAVTLIGHRTVVESLYIQRPEWKRVAAELVAAAAQRYGNGRALHATVRHEHAHAYTAAGFEVVGETANFVKLTRKPS